ncbi:MAG: hypothetical protein RAP70_04690 [Candidatus Celaenobacter antarcticus]|nr:hypothetical protein [Candidatus Celaenobacter antarcticus]MDP8314355.1 hypothetical protein [Candidatus Celaenobacter antarcticus]
MVESLKLYFSEDVPKLIPFEIAKYAIDSKNVFEKIPGGFVKNNDFEIKELNKE